MLRRRNDEFAGGFRSGKKSELRSDRQAGRPVLQGGKMANTTQEELYQSFLTVSGQQTSALGDATALLADAIARVSEQQSSNPAPVAALQTSAAGDTTALLADVIGQAREQQSSNPAPIPAANQTQTGTQAGSNSSGSTSGTVEKTMLEAEAGLPLLIAGLGSAFGRGGGVARPGGPLGRGEKADAGGRGGAAAADRRAGECVRRWRRVDTGAAGEIRDAGGGGFPGSGEPGASERSGLRPDGSAAELRDSGDERDGEWRGEWRSKRQWEWEWRGAAVHLQRAGDGRALLYGPERRHSAGSAGRDAQSELDQRCGKRPLIWQPFLN